MCARELPGGVVPRCPSSRSNSRLATFPPFPLVTSQLLKYAKFAPLTALNFPAFNIFQTLAPSRSFRKIGSFIFSNLRPHLFRSCALFYTAALSFQYFVDSLAENNRGVGCLSSFLVRLSRPRHNEDFVVSQCATNKLSRGTSTRGSVRDRLKKLP
jgi:hypothetical protein